MNRVIIYTVVVLAVTIPTVLLASTLIETEEDRLEQIIGGLEQGSFDTMLDAAAFDQGGLIVSAGREAQRFGVTEREAARALLVQETGLDGSDRARLRQRRVTVRGERATAILNLELDRDIWVALRVNLSRSGDQWRVERIRVMG